MVADAVVLVEGFWEAAPFLIRAAQTIALHERALMIEAERIIWKILEVKVEASMQIRFCASQIVTFFR